jgi:hypothetical protein
MRRATEHGVRRHVVRWCRSITTSIAVVAVVGPLVAASLAGCAAQVVPTIDTELPETTVPAGDAAKFRVQAYATQSMAAMGDAYRQAIKDNEVSDSAMVLLGDGFSANARDAEEANLRDAIQSRNSLARVPGDPELLIDIVTDQADGCYIVEAAFDDRPLLAFPTAIRGIPVVARFRLNSTDEIWRIDELISAVRADENPLRCPLPGEVQQDTPSTVVTTSSRP